MRKRTYGISMFFVVVLLPSFSGASVHSDLRSLENQHDLDDADMYTMIYTRDVGELLEDACAASDITEAGTRVSVIQSLLGSRYDTMSDAQILLHSRDLYERLREKHLSKADILDSVEYCKVKYIMYHIQQYLRDKHLGILEDSDIMKDFDGFGVREIHGRSIKRDMLETMIQELHTYKSLL